MGIYTGSGDLESQGPLLQVNLLVSSALERSLLADNKPVPNAIECKALIDTGSTRTVIKNGLAEKLQLHPVSSVSVKTASGVRDKCSVYSIQLVLPNGSTADLKQVVELPLDDQGIDVIIGRDILAQSLFVYIGTENIFTLSLQES